MIVTFEIIEDYSTDAVEFYTVRIEEQELTEYEKFYDKEFPEHLEELNILDSVIHEIGIRGAKRYYFKPEGSAHAIPIVPETVKDENVKDFGIRLYCIQVNENVVVLLNGDIKTKRNPKDCENVKRHFLLSQKIATALDRDICQNEIDVTKPNNLNHYELEL